MPKIGFKNKTEIEITEVAANILKRRILQGVKKGFFCYEHKDKLGIIINISEITYIK